MIEPDDGLPLPHLWTEHLELLAPNPALAAAVLDFYARNQAHFAAWEPQRTDEFYRLEHHVTRLEQQSQSWLAGHAFQWWLRPRHSDDGAAPVIGQMHFSSVVRGVSHSANLGYAMCSSCEGRGWMLEALRAGIEQLFSNAVGLHRIQAAHRPENHRSAALLARLGFEREGLAREYLFIAGAWRDHVITALRNPHWQGDPGR